MENNKTVETEDNKVGGRKTSKLNTLKQLNGTIEKIKEIKAEGYTTVCTDAEMKVFEKVRLELRNLVLGGL